MRVRNLTPVSVADSLGGISQINHVALVSGAHDLYLEATCRDQSQLIALLDEIRRHPGVAAIQPIIVTSLAKDYTWNGLSGVAGQSIGDPNG
nr:Lrp/AsnC ligand binding domain-containing protein [Leucobacter weissii]